MHLKNVINQFIEIIPTTWVKPLIIGLNVLSCLLLITTAISLYGYLNQSKQSINTQTPTTTKTITLNLQALKSPLFGPYIETLNNVPESDLDIQLMGVLKSDKSGESSVLIQVNNQEKILGVNDSLPGGTKLIRIYPSSILIERDGHLEKISLPKETLNLLPLSKPMETNQ